MNGEKRQFKIIWDLVNLSLFISMVTMIIFVFANTALRYLFSSSIKVSAEISSYLFVWVIMLGAAVALNEDRHLDVRIIDNFLPKRVLSILRICVQLLILACSVIILVGCYRQAIIDWTNISPLSRIPRGVLYISGAISGFLMSAIAIYSIFTIIKGKGIK